MHQLKMFRINKFEITINGLKWDLQKTILFAKEN